jgi:diaminohydroxyphosphoribosylaminopyrimidine deaminase/5-amino-6-(5-phosphoribosylamino)uracil reductase
VEAGPKLNTALLAANLIDQVALFRSPAEIGEGGINALHGLPSSALVDSAHLRRAGTERIGPDLLELYERP